MSTETNTAGTRTLTFHDGDQVSAWITGPEHFTEMLVGVWTPREAWAAKADMSGSVRFDGTDRETWANLIRLVHLHLHV